MSHGSFRSSGARNDSGYHVFDAACGAKVRDVGFPQLARERQHVVSRRAAAVERGSRTAARSMVEVPCGAPAGRRADRSGLPCRQRIPDRRHCVVGYNAPHANDQTSGGGRPGPGTPDGGRIRRGLAALARARPRAASRRTRRCPTRWSATENVAWKAPIAGAGVSTPIVSGDRVFVTSQLGAGVRREGNHPRLVQGSDAAAQGERALASDVPAGADASRTFFVVEAFNRADGKRFWERRIEAARDAHAGARQAQPRDAEPCHRRQLVFAWFGTGQIVGARSRAARSSGSVTSPRRTAPFDIQWGHGSSPVLYRDLLILLCDQPARVVPARGRQGHRARIAGRRIAVRAARRTARRSSIEATVRRRAHRELDGTHRCLRREDRDVSLARRARTSRFAVPIAGLSRRRDLREPRLSQRSVHGDQAGRARRRERARSSGASRPARRTCRRCCYYDGIVYMANDVGVLTAVDAASGERIWQERVDGVFSASPVAGGGHVYFVSESGDTIVVKAGRAPQVVGAQCRSASARWRRPRSRTARSSSAPTSTCSRWERT